ncbi:autotransporter outer membrane beta-barrel domain-containing protein [Bradyrhizobium sp. HKCCYLRH3099]|uniref:autotransporter outer membrane beta-barrel domain-containing protein n=1 Tax=unclassified Bradyrhizobium TaxID=2631580 RepID=UPI003EB8343D
MTSHAALAQQCQSTGTNQTCTNSLALTGSATGLQDNATATVTNSGGASISGSAAAGFGLSAQTANVTNFGTISGSGQQAQGVTTGANATVVNAGAITGISTLGGTLGYGINAGNDGFVANSGTIAGITGANGLGFAIIAFGNANVTNSGTISGSSGENGSSYGVLGGRDVRLVNSGSLLSSSTGQNGSAIAVRGVNNVDVSNSGRLASSGGDGSQAFGVLSDLGDLRIANSGTLTAMVGASGQASGVVAIGGAANVTNSGIIAVTGGTSGFGIQSGQDATLANSGSIVVSSDQQAIGLLTGGNATVTNSGTITAVAGGAGSGIGISAGNNAAIVNSGTIIGVTPQGSQGFGIQASGTANVTNSGEISGSLAALQFAGGADTLTVLRGSRIIGAINLGGGGDTVNFRGGNHNLTFDTLAGATVTGTTPFVVSGNRAVAIDPTSFASTGRTLNDFSRGVSDAVPVFTGSRATGGAPLGFAAPEASSRIDDAFAAMSGLSAYASPGMAYKNPTVVYGDGSAVWGRGFGGQRIQQQDGVLPRTTNLFYGGMIGGDWQAGSGLRLGAFLGGGQTRSSADFNFGTTNADLVFGGAYARYDLGASFLNAAVQAGGSRNTASRTINNNLVAGGLETAAANFNGWYVSPEATFGHRWGLGSLGGATYTLTPSFRLRYLYGSYAGYTETGTTAPLTVNGQTVSLLEERGEMKLTRSVVFAPTDVLSTSITAGLLGTHKVGSNTVNASLLGQAIPFAIPGQSNVWGGFGGLGLEWQSRNVTLFSAAEYLALSDRSNVVSGRAGLRVSF